MMVNMSVSTMAISRVHVGPARHATRGLFALRPLFHPLLSDKGANGMRNDSIQQQTLTLERWAGRPWQ
jgi:hypothetical protein